MASKKIEQISNKLPGKREDGGINADANADNLIRWLKTEKLDKAKADEEQS